MSHFLLKLISKSTCIEIIDLSNTSIESTEAPALAEILLTNTNLKEIDLHNNNILAEGAK
jgi:Ran GTPase-activating protein (RanGAP) involved in mRNA processing and transport